MGTGPCCPAFALGKWDLSNQKLVFAHWELGEKAKIGMGESPFSMFSQCLTNSLSLEFSRSSYSAPLIILF